MFIHPSLSGHLGGFHLLATVNNAVQVPDFNSFGHISRYGIAGSHGSSIFTFLRNCHTVSTAAVPVHIPNSSVQALQVTSFSIAVLLLPPPLPSCSHPHWYDLRLSEISLCFTAESPGSPFDLWCVRVHTSLLETFLLLISKPQPTKVCGHGKNPNSASRKGFCGDL